MDDQDDLKVALERLKAEHRELDEEIGRMTQSATFDQIQVQRLKKRKLALKDQIARLDSRLRPDIIA